LKAMILPFALVAGRRLWPLPSPPPLETLTRSTQLPDVHGVGVIGGGRMPANAGTEAAVTPTTTPFHSRTPRSAASKLDANQRLSLPITLGRILKPPPRRSARISQPLRQRQTAGS